VAALAGSSPADWARLATHLEEETAVAGLELALPGDSGPFDASAWVGAVRRACTLPVLARLPATLAGELAGACADAGADALVIATPPVAAYPAGDGSLLEAPVGGPAAFPFTLRALRAVARPAVGLPLVAAGGIYHPDDARLCLEQGAIAVQVRGLLWSDPAGAARLAAALQLQAEFLPGTTPQRAET
jgi:dihydroorotate dehydrogenase